MPSRKIGARDITHFSALHEIVERAENFFRRSKSVKAVQMINVDVVGPQPPQARLASLDQMVPRRAEIVRSRGHAKRRLARDQNIGASPTNRFAEDLLRDAVGIHIGCVKQVDASFAANVDQSRSFGDVARSPGLEEFGGAAKCSGAEAEDRYF